MTLTYQYSRHADDWGLEAEALGLHAGAWGRDLGGNGSLSSLMGISRNKGGNVSRRLGAQDLILEGRRGALGTRPRVR